MQRVCYEYKRLTWFPISSALPKKKAVSTFSPKSVNKLKKEAIWDQISIRQRWPCPWVSHSVSELIFYFNVFRAVQCKGKDKDIGNDIEWYSWLFLKNWETLIMTLRIIVTDSQHSQFLWCFTIDLLCQLLSFFACFFLSSVWYFCVGVFFYLS